MKPARPGWIFALVVAATLGAAVAREASVGKDEVTAADAAADHADWPEAIAHARAAAEALAPGTPWSRRGFVRLEAIGHDAEARADDTTALAAYGAMRTAALATRGLASGSHAWRTLADKGLARVTADAKATPGPHVSAESMLDALREHEPPPTTTLALLAAAGLAMLAGFGRLAWSASPKRDRVALGLAVAGLVTYAVVAMTT